MHKLAHSHFKFAFLLLIFAIVGHAQPTPSTLPAISGVDAGSLNGSFEVSDNGAATYSVALSVPPGTAGLEPKLGLSYSSQSGNSFLGIGWSLSGLSSIARCLPSMAQEPVFNLINFDEHDRYCLDGQKLVVVAGQYSRPGSEYRTVVETFSKIIANGHSGPYWGSGPESFTVQSKNGLTYLYGSSSDSRLEASGAEGILSWLLKRVTDRNGNYYEISYQKDQANGELFPIRIDYTGNTNAGLAPYNSVRFAYDSTPIRSRYLGGQSYQTRHRLSRVEMFTESTKVWEYQLSYSIDSVKAEDRLASIRECDPNGACLPETNFTWGDINLDSLAFSPGASIPDLGIGAGFLNRKRSPIITGDWNGDGRTDVGRVLGTNIKFYAANSSGGFEFYDQINWSLPLFNDDTDGEAFPTVVGDWNGDGRTDVMRANLVTTGNGTVYKFYTSSGTGFSDYLDIHRSDMLESGSCTFVAGNNQQIVTGDWNGDGRTDIGRVSAGNCSSFITWVATGTLFAASAPNLSSATSCSLTECPYFTGDWNGDSLTDIARITNDRIKFYASRHLPYAPLFDFNEYSNIIDYSPAQGYLSNETHPIVVGDWNNDGLTDFGRVGNVGISLCIGLGQPYYIPWIGFAACQTYPFLSPAQGFANTDSNPLVLGDWNNDGTADIARVGTTGISVLHVKEFAPFLVNEAPYFSASQSYNSNFSKPIFVGDWNGDGFTDIARVSLDGIETITHAYSQSSSIVEIQDGFGETTRIDYSEMTDPSVYTKGTAGSYSTGIDVQTPMKLVRRVEVTDNATTSSYLNYRYKGYRFDPVGRQSSGFTEIVTTNEQSGSSKTTFYRQDNPSFNGLPYKTETRLANGTLIHQTEDTWAVQGIAPVQSNHYIAVSREYSYELDGSLVQSSQTNFWVDTWGNASVIQTLRSDGSGESTDTTFLNEPSTWTIGLPIATSVTKTTASAQGGTSIARRANFQYGAANSKIIAEITEQGALDEIVRSYSYDVFGNLTLASTSAAGMQSRSASTAYDSKGRFPISSTNALGQTEIRTYSDSHGKPTSVTDINGLTTTFSYDSFGREILVVNPDSTQKRTRYYKYAPSPSLNASHLIRTDVSGLGPSISYYDGLSREIRRESIGFGGAKILVDMQYDDEGRLVRQSEPYFEGATPVWTETTYDALDRVVQVIEPGANVATTTYTPHWKTRTNSLGQTTAQQYDDQGRMVASVDPSGQQTTFKYDAYGNLVQVTDALGATITNQFSVRGLKLSTMEPNSGLTTFQYNPLGELTQQTQSNGSTHSFTFDKLGRLVQRTSSEGIESWVYDTAPHGVGKLHKVFGLNGYEEAFTYDGFGRINSVSRLINGTRYDVNRTYNGNGLVSELTYPTGFTTVSQYDSNGHLLGLIRKDTKGSIWKPLLKNARDQIEGQLYGNGVRTDKIFNPNNGLVTSIRSGSGGIVQDLHYQFDSIGNLTSRQDLLNNLSESFTYDNLNRLTAAQVAGQPAITMTYNEVGNIVTRSDVGSYLYAQNGAGVHAVTSITGVRPDTFTYDSVGNRITSSSGTITYNSVGKVVSATKGIHSVEFTLNPSYERVQETIRKSGQVQERKVYVDKMYEEVNQNGRIRHLHYVTVGDHVVAIITSTQRTYPALVFNDRTWKNQTRYIHHDHLGSIQAVTSETGAIIETLSFSAWGERRDPFTWSAVSTPVSSVDLGFTGHEQLDEVGLIHMNGRVYDPVVGRFTSPDPMSPPLTNMQNLNRYSYVNNNPLSFVDPSGYFLSGFFKRLARFAGRALPMLVSAAAFYFAPMAFTPLFSQAFSSLTCSTLGISVISGLSGVASGIVASAASSLVSGGGLGAGLRAGFKDAHFSFLSAFAANQIGTRFEYASGIKKAVAHALTNGAIGAARGEKFIASAASSFASSMGGGSYLRSLALGGTAAMIGGGKFEDGVMRAAVIHMFNDRGDGHAKEDQDKSWIERKLGSELYEDLGYVLTHFEENHPIYVNSVKYGSVALSFTAGGFLAAGFAVPKALSFLDTSFAILAVSMEGMKLSDIAQGYSINRARYLGGIAFRSNQIGRVFEGHTQIGLGGYNIIRDLHEAQQGQ